MNLRTTALVALIFVVIYNIFFFQTDLGIGTGLLFLVLNVYFFLTKSPEVKNLNLALIFSVSSISFAFLFGFRSNGLVQAVNLLSATFLSFLALYFYKYNGRIEFKIPKLLLIPLLVIENFFGKLFGLLKIQGPTSDEFKSDSTSSLIKGVIITVPIIAVLLILLTQADPIFGKLTQNLLSNIGERAIVSLCVFTVILGFGLTKFFEKSHEEETPEHTVSDTKSHELAVITGSILGLFAVFIFIQFRYLFFTVGESELHQLGINSLTFSEYVRKGFFELLIASTIASGVIIYVLRYLHNLKNKPKQLLQILSAVLTVETGLLLLSAAKRVFLYADAHGLTRARIFGFIFMMWLAVILIIFLIRIFKEMKKEWFFTATLTSVLLALLTINLINVDGLIATKYKPTVNDEIDYYYITSLSADAKDSWIEAVKDSDRIITSLETLDSLSPEDNRKLHWTRLTIDQLYYKIGVLIDKYGNLKEIRNWHVNEQGTWNGGAKTAQKEQDLPDYLKTQRKWQAINLTEYESYRIVMEDISSFELIPNLQSRINKLESKVSHEVRMKTPLDRATKAPLTR